MNRRLLLMLLALAVAAGFSALGAWQLGRAVEKERMLASVTSVLERREPRSLASAGEASATGYAWASGMGRFLPSPVLMLDNQRREGQVGVQVFGVFLPDDGRPILVGLGWLPVPGDRTLPVAAMPAGRVSVSGLLTPPPSTGLALGPPYTQGADGRWLMTRLDAKALSSALRVDLQPRILRLDPALALGFPRDLDILPNTLPPERHRGYALQWFGLALATIITALLLAFRRRTPK